MTAIGTRGYALSMSKTGRWREASVLLLPVLALGGVALWMQARAPRDESGPFGLVVQRVERQDATARDVAEGFDTRFVVSLGHRGRRPEHWGEATASRGLGSPRCFDRVGRRWRAWEQKRVSDRSLVFDADSGTYRSTFAMRLADPSSTSGEMRVKLNIMAEAWRERAYVGIIPEKSSFEFTARRAGESITKPQVSRLSPLRVQRVVIQKLTWDGARPMPGLEAMFFLHPPGPPTGLSFSKRKPQILHTYKGGYFEDERGRRFPDPQSYSGSQGFDGTVRRTFEVPNLPKARRLTWHARVSLDESWPVQIKAVLWDKTRSAVKS